MRVEIRRTKIIRYTHRSKNPVRVYELREWVSKCMSTNLRVTNYLASVVVNFCIFYHILDQIKLKFFLSLR